MKYVECLKRIFKLISKKILIISFVLLFFYFCISIAEIFLPFVFKLFIDKIETEKIIDLFYGNVWALGVLILSISKNLLSALNDLIQYNAVNSFSVKIFNLYMSGSLNDNKELTSQKLTSYTHDYAENALRILDINKSSALFELLKMLCVVMLMFFIDYVLGIITIVTILITVLIYRFGNKSYMKNARVIRQKSLELYDVVEDQIDGRDEIENFNIKLSEEKKVKTLVSDVINKINVQTVKNFIVLFFFQDYVRIIYELTIISCSLYFVFINRISLGALVITVWYSNMVSNPIMFFSAIFSSVRNSFNDMNMLLEKLPEEKDIMEEKKISEESCGLHKIILEDSSLLCSNNNQYNISFTRGNIYLIDGASGCGKTTLLESIAAGSLCKFRTEKDEIKNPQKYIHYMTQKGKIFPLSLQDNILFGNVYSGYKQLIALLSLEYLKDKPYLTETELSGGEKSKIFFARALASNKDWFILDEPLTGLDDEQIVKILNETKIFFTNKTLIFTSHSKIIKDIILGNNSNTRIYKMNK